MSNTYAKKLLGTIYSALLVCLVTALCTLVGWFIDLRQYETDNGAVDLFHAAAVLGESLAIFVLLMPLVLFWHFWDLVEPSPTQNRSRPFLFRYPAFIAVMLGFGLDFMLIGTGFFTRNSCDQLDGALFHECFITISLWAMIPLGVFGIGLLVLCVIKACFVIALLIQRTAFAGFAPSDETGED